MTTNEYRAATVLASALILGIGADLLLRTTPWGLNALLWVTGLAAASSLVSRASPLDGGLAAPLLFFAGMIAWSDAPLLTVLNGAAVVGLLVVPLVRGSSTSLLQARGRHLVAAGRRLGHGFLTVPALLPESGALRHTSGRVLWSSSIGLAVTIPTAAVFVTLFGNADPAFARLAERVFSPNLLGRGIDHVLFAGLFAWPAAAYLRSIIRTRNHPTGAPALPSPRLALPAVAIPLGSTIVIFSSYLVLQAGYLFGGADFLARTPGLTTAVYARRGFFELVTAATLVVPLLMAAQWGLAPTRINRRGLTVLAPTLVALVVGVVGSAFHRMLLYWQSFGLSQDRVYATVFMAWVGFVLLWFAATVVTRRPARFVSGAGLSALLLLGAVNLANVDGLVVRANVARAAGGHVLDVSYHARTLSADAVPVLARSLDRLDIDTRCALTQAIDGRWRETGRDWRSWNVARWRAATAVAGGTFQRAVRGCPQLQGASEATSSPQTPSPSPAGG